MDTLAIAFTTAISTTVLQVSRDRTIELLHQAFRTVKQNHPFTIDAIVVLPDRIRWIWTLPSGDADFSKRWRLIKSEFSRHWFQQFKRQPSPSRLNKGEPAIWQ